MYQTQVEFKVMQGATFAPLFELTDDFGVAVSLDNATITAHIKNASDKLLAEMELTAIDAVNGVFTLGLPSGYDLPAGQSYLNVKLEFQGGISKSQNVLINVIKSVTL